MHSVCGRVCGEEECFGFRRAEWMQVVSALETMETMLFVNNQATAAGNGALDARRKASGSLKIGEASSQAGGRGGGGRGAARGERAGDARPRRRNDGLQTRRKPKIEAIRKTAPAVLAQRLLQAGSWRAALADFKTSSQSAGPETPVVRAVHQAFQHHEPPKPTKTHQPTAIQAAIQRSPAGQRVTARRQPMLDVHRAVETLRPAA